MEIPYPVLVMRIMDDCPRLTRHSHHTKTTVWVRQTRIPHLRPCLASVQTVASQHPSRRTARQHHEVSTLDIDNGRLRGAFADELIRVNVDEVAAGPGLAVVRGQIGEAAPGV